MIIVAYGVKLLVDKSLRERKVVSGIDLDNSCSTQPAVQIASERRYPWTFVTLRGYARSAKSRSHRLVSIDAVPASLVRRH